MTYLIRAMLPLLVVLLCVACASAELLSCSDLYNPVSGFSRNGTINRLFSAYGVPQGLNTMATTTLNADWMQYADEFYAPLYSSNVFTKAIDPLLSGILAYCNSGPQNTIARTVTYTQCKCLETSDSIEYFNDFLMRKEIGPR